MSLQLTEGGGRMVARLANGSPMPFDIPDADHDEWLRDVPEVERARVRELFRCFFEMLAARNLRAGAEAAAMRRAHLGWGWAAKTLLHLFWAYRDGGHKPGDHRKTGPVYKAGDWRVLLREYRNAKPGVPPEFARWIGEQWAQFRGREDCVRAMWRHVVQELWLKGAPVPGYGTIDEWCRRTGRARPHPLLVRPGELPEGWSEDTFRRLLPRRKSVRKQVAHNYLEAHGHQPDMVRTDRSKLLPMQFIYLDDSRPDFRCLHMGASRGEMVYPLLVLGLDACSGVDLANVAKPRAMKEDGKGRHGITQDMALLVVVNTLRRFGLPPWPITFVHENAAACVPSEARHLLEGAFGERIQFEATSIFKERMLEHGFTVSGGCPWEKAPIEAFWRILMTQLARLPGSTGPRYDDNPKDLTKIEAYTLKLLDRAGGVEEVVAKLRKPLLEFPEAHDAIEAALRLLRFRTGHSLQGFDRVREWRRSPADNYQPWEAFLALPVEEQNAVTDIIARLECPAERFCRLLAGVEMTPVNDDLLTWLASPRRPVRVRDGRIQVKDTERHGDDVLIFREIDHPLLSPDAEGKTFDGAIAGDGTRIVLAEEGRILGSVARQDLIDRADKAALRRASGAVRAARAADRELLRGYLLADTDSALAEMRTHNEAVLAAAPQIAAAAPEPKAKIQHADAKAILLSRARAQDDDEG